MTSPPAKKVSASIIRHKFNTGQYYERAKSGELSVYLKRDSEPKRLPPREPPGTRSQILYYYNGEELVAVVHQYLRPDNSLGGSGLPDPKRLVLDDGIIYVPSKSPKDT